MRQAPFKYLIIGNGRLALHLKTYLQLLDIPYKCWSRKNNTQEELVSCFNDTSYVLLAISDKAIESFIHKHVHFLKNKILIHFSGSLYFEEDYFSNLKIFGAHPLMSFSYDKYDLKTYEKIPFVCDKKKQFKKLFPDLKNESYYLEPEKKALYHALCVTGGNFTNILWQKVEEEFSSQLGLPSTVLTPYKERVFENTLNNPSQTLSGPFVRNDKTTIENNIKAFGNESLKALYINFYQIFNDLKLNTNLENEPEDQIKAHKKDQTLTI